MRWALAVKVSAPSSVPATRYRAVRGFARYMAGIDPETEIPPAGLVRRPRSRRPPFIYTDEELLALLEQARSSIPQPLRAATMQTLIGLLAATGLRVGEALRLDRGDIDWSEGVLHIRQSKFNKSRLVPLSPSVVEALERYAHLRDRERPAAAGESFFVSLRGTRVIHECVWKTFRALCDAAGVGAGSSVRPTIHDLRHRFAVRVLARLVPGGRRRSAPSGLAVDLPRASRPGLELLVSVRRAGAARARRPPARRPPGR